MIRVSNLQCGWVGVATSTTEYLRDICTSARDSGETFILVQLAFNIYRHRDSCVCVAHRVKLMRCLASLTLPVYSYILGIYIRRRPTVLFMHTVCSSFGQNIDDGLYFPESDHRLWGKRMSTTEQFPRVIYIIQESRQPYLSRLAQW
ncbi:hypothetical protein BDV35DRAFT_367904 [Aspergillus flavus]|uniref:Uncharacterized protein n=1 Tax=Aspergillus flavus TaxID=5059 RepID=A0A5N6GLI7_ASPFL|nr:hypothetical protein BDV35DRAFT_367904 [Aspergillus flavus]